MCLTLFNQFELFVLLDLDIYATKLYGSFNPATAARVVYGHDLASFYEAIGIICLWMHRLHTVNMNENIYTRTLIDDELEHARI